MKDRASIEATLREIWDDLNKLIPEYIDDPEVVKPEYKTQFLVSITKRLQKEFENNVNMPDAENGNLQPLLDKLRTDIDPEERQDIEFEIEEKKYELHRRALGTIRFIVEMYKLKQLTPDRIMTCIESLQDHDCEEKLEYMCTLLTAVGHLIDATVVRNFDGKNRLDRVFSKMKETVENAGPNSSGKASKINISRRIRFMMRDVMDLRLKHWYQTPSLTTKSPISVSWVCDRGVDSGSQHQQRKHNLNKKNNRINYDSQRTHYGGLSSQWPNHLDRDDSGENLKHSQKFNYQQEKKVADYKKFTFSKCDESSSVGNSLAYKWRLCGNEKPAETKQKDDSSSQDTMLANSLAYNWRVREKPMGTMEKSTGSHISGISSANSHRYGSSSNNSNTDKNNEKQQLNPFFGSLSLKKMDTDRPSASETLAISSNKKESDVEEKFISANTVKDYRKQIIDFVEEFMECAPSNVFDWQSHALSTWRANTPKQQVEMIYYLLADYLYLHKVTKVERAACAAVFLYLLQTKAFDKNIFGKAYDQFAEGFSDMLIDVPDGCTRLFEFLGPLLHDELLSFEDIWRDFWNDDKMFTERFVEAFSREMMSQRIHSELR